MFGNQPPHPPTFWRNCVSYKILKILILLQLAEIKLLFCMVVALVLKSWDQVRPSLPSLGQNPNFYLIFLKDSPSIDCKILDENTSSPQTWAELFGWFGSIYRPHTQCLPTPTAPDDEVTLLRFCRILQLYPYSQPCLADFDNKETHFKLSPGTR